MPAERLRRTAGRPSERAAGARVAELFEQHGRMVYGVCRLLLRDREEAEDATQQTFLSAYRSLLGGTEPDEPAAWLGTIARNECRGRIRARAAAPLALVVETSEPVGDVEIMADQHEEVAALVDMLAELPPHQREAIVLREFYGLSHEEVGHALGVTPSAVDSLLVRARRRLQTALRPARLASGALVLPLALRESLAQAMPGFAATAGGGGAFAKLASLPIAAKLTAGAATVTAVGVVAGAQLPPPPAAKHAPTPVEAARPAPRTPSEPPPPTPPAPVAARPIAAFTQSGDGDDGRTQDRIRRDDEDDQEIARPDVDEREDEPEHAAGARQPGHEAEEADDDETDERRPVAEPEDEREQEDREDADEPEPSGDGEDD